MPHPRTPLWHLLAITVGAVATLAGLLALGRLLVPEPEPQQPVPRSGRKFPKWEYEEKLSRPRPLAGPGTRSLGYVSSILTGGTYCTPRCHTATSQGQRYHTARVSSSQATTKAARRFQRVR